MKTTPEQRHGLFKAATFGDDRALARRADDVVAMILDLDAAERRIAELEAEVKDYEAACLSYELHLQPTCWRCHGERPEHKPYCGACDGVVQRAEQA